MLYTSQLGVENSSYCGLRSLSSRCCCKWSPLNDELKSALRTMFSRMFAIVAYK